MPNMLCCDNPFNFKSVLHLVFLRYLQQHLEVKYCGVVGTEIFALLLLKVTYKQIFITSAVNISLGTLYYKADSEVPDDYKDERIQDRDKKVVMTCSIGACAAIGGKLLKDMGFKKVSHIDGGFGAIRQSKFKIV